MTFEHVSTKLVDDATMTREFCHTDSFRNYTVYSILPGMIFGIRRYYSIGNNTRYWSTEVVSLYRIHVLECSSRTIIDEDPSLPRRYFA